MEWAAATRRSMASDFGNVEIERRGPLSIFYMLWITCSSRFEWIWINVQRLLIYNLSITNKWLTAKIVLHLEMVKAAVCKRQERQQEFAFHVLAMFQTVNTTKYTQQAYHHNNGSCGSRRSSTQSCQFTVTQHHVFEMRAHDSWSSDLGPGRSSLSRAHSTLLARPQLLHRQTTIFTTPSAAADTIADANASAHLSTRPRPAAVAVDELGRFSRKNPCFYVLFRVF